MTKGKILVADDDSDIREVLKLYLNKEGYDVIEAEDGNLAVAVFERENPDLLILDVMMPGLDGFEVCQIVRQKSDLPILFLSAKEDDVDKIVGLGIGGDDFISKPFSPSVLTAKVKAHFRRNRLLGSKSKSEHEENRIISYKGLIIDQDNYSVKLDGYDVHLSVKEYKILTLLAGNPKRVFTTEQIFQNVWDEDSFGDYRTVMVHISNLRKKIESDPANPDYILTVRGVGYKFNHLG
ncbi:DNA-binding response regulator [Pueribacillus theae]|uniref:DNA-binding response regulator n=1 Tax=Pueribacillus theae TaxID=2171751 RepID=A0A2U1K2J1_9BACI|nr:response regulator transcription factor [Pueribacillus theae]PWA11178.1 DNA-binding response regulator [Pueribacillus theae]